MAVITSLQKRAKQRPVGVFLGVLLLNAVLVVTALYAVFGSEFPTLAAIPYAWTPMVSAGVTVWLLDDSVRDWLGQLRTVRAGINWYLGGTGIMLIATDFESIVAVLLGVDIVAPADSIGQYLLFFAVTLFLAGALEELGWRGFMQPRLQQRFSALTTSVVIGLVWACWHVPLILAGAGDFSAFHEYIVMVVATSVILGWLYNNTEGALPVVMLTHAASNMAPFGEVTGDIPAFFGVVPGNIIFYVACATLIVLYAGWKTLTTDGTLPDIPGQPTEKPLQHAD